MIDAAPARDLMDLWAHGWALARGAATPTRTAFGCYVHVGIPGQQGRYVLDREASGDVGAVACGIEAPDTFIKALGAPAEIAPLLPDAWTVVSNDWLMTAPLRAFPDEKAPAGYALRSRVDHCMTVEVLTEEGGIAASGKAAVVDDWCVFDQIVTSPQHRRRGLGALVMNKLSAAGLAAAARHGLLVATDEGRLLYERLGWALEGPVTSAVRSDDELPRPRGPS